MEKNHFFERSSAEQTAEALFKKYFARLSYYAFQYVNDKDLADDLAQDAFVAYLDSNKEISHHPNVIKDFLYTAVRNSALNYIKRQKVQERYFSLRNEDKVVKEKVLESLIEAEVMADLHKAIAQLPLSCRSVFLLAYFEGLSNTEISEKLNISINTVRCHKQNGLKVLRSRLKTETFLALLVLIFG